MRSNGIGAFALLAGALIIGCAELPTADVPEASFNFMNNPKWGPVVYRFNRENFWYVTADPDHGRVAVHGFDVTNSVPCGGSSSADTAALQVVFPGNDEFFQQIFRADNQYVAVYSANSWCELAGCPFDVDMWCESATGPRLLAHGDAVKFRWQQTYGKKWIWTYEGFITDWINGGILHYLEHQNAVLKDGVWVWINEDIRLNAVPGR